jgi:polyhydroxyalkanoate synthesis repressor PhaR
MLTKTDSQRDGTDSVVIKKYANRRLYNTETSTYVTLDDLAEMVRSDRDFVVFDAKTGADLTHTVLTQIIVEQESRGETLLPIPFLRQLIRFYDDSMSRMVPTYLQFSMEALAREQERYRKQFANAFGPTAAFEAYQEQARRNMAIFEQAMSMWTPFPGSPSRGSGSEGQTTSEAGEGAEAGQGVQPQASGAAAGSSKELNELRNQLAQMQQKIEKLSSSSDDK